MKNNVLNMFIRVSWMIAIVTGIAIVNASNIPGEKSPGIVFDTVDHDFGDQVSGKILKHTFTFKNLGATLFSIKDVKAG